MNTFCKVILQGVVTEVSTSVIHGTAVNGKVAARMSVQTSYEVKDEHGKTAYMENAWHDIHAESTEKISAEDLLSIKKGFLINVEGRLKYNVTCDDGNVVKLNPQIVAEKLVIKNTIN